LPLSFDCALRLPFEEPAAGRELAVSSSLAGTASTAVATLRVESALVRFVAVDFSDADFDFAFAVLPTVAALFVARAHAVRRTLDAAAMRRSPFRIFNWRNAVGWNDRHQSGEILASHFPRYTEMMPEKRRAVNS
jgi:hypothetical protein